MTDFSMPLRADVAKGLPSLLWDRLEEALVVLDADGRVEASNLAGRRLLGGCDRPGELLSLERWEAEATLLDGDGQPLPAELRPSVRAGRGEIFSHHELVRGQLSRPSRYYMVSGAPVGEAGGYALIFEDVSALRRRESELSTLYTLTAAAVEVRQPDALLKEALAHILKLTNLPSGLLLYHTSDRSGCYLAASGLPKTLVDGLVAFEREHGAEALYASLADGSLAHGGAAIVGELRHVLTSWVVLPLHRDEVLSGLMVLGAAEYHQLSDDLSKLLSTLVTQLLLSIELNQVQAYLEERVRLRTAEIQEAHEKLEGLVEELKRMDQFKTDFLSNVSHELRTPLSGIIGYGEFLAEGVYGDLSPEQQQVLEQLVTNSYQLMELINNLLDLSRIDAGKLRLYKEPIELGALFQQSVGKVAPQAMQKQIGLHLPEGPLPVVEVDPGRIVQVLVNLLSNAIKFTPAHGEITLRVTEAEGVATVAVQDTGIGIPQELLPKLFVRFSQGDSSSTRQFGGTGLGLAISRELIELHDQRIWGESTPQQGSTFYFTVPVWHGAAEAHEV